MQRAIQQLFVFTFGILAFASIFPVHANAGLAPDGYPWLQADNTAYESVANASSRAGAGLNCLQVSRLTHFSIQRLSLNAVHLAQAASVASESNDIKDDPRIKRWRITLLYGAILLIVFITAATAIIVFSRRWRQWIRGGRKAGPTNADDVWAMHHLPDADESPDDPFPNDKDKLI